MFDRCGVHISGRAEYHSLRGVQSGELIVFIFVGVALPDLIITVSLIYFFMLICTCIRISRGRGTGNLLIINCKIKTVFCEEIYAHFFQRTTCCYGDSQQGTREAFLTIPTVFILRSLIILQNLE